MNSGACLCSAFCGIEAHWFDVFDVFHACLLFIHEIAWVGAVGPSCVINQSTKGISYSRDEKLYL